MKKRKYTIQKDLTILSFSLFVVVTLWIAFTIHGIYVTSTISDTLQIQIVPIKGVFDESSIEIIKNRTPIIPDYSASVSANTLRINALPIDQPQPTSEVTLTPTDVFLPNSTSSAEPSL